MNTVGDLKEVKIKPFEVFSPKSDLTDIFMPTTRCYIPINGKASKISFNTYCNSFGSERAEIAPLHGRDGYIRVGYFSIDSIECMVPRAKTVQFPNNHSMLDKVMLNRGSLIDFLNEREIEAGRQPKYKKGSFFLSILGFEERTDDAVLKADFEEIVKGVVSKVEELDKRTLEERKAQIEKDKEDVYLVQSWFPQVKLDLTLHIALRRLFKTKVEEEDTRPVKDAKERVLKEAEIYFSNFDALVEKIKILEEKHGKLNINCRSKTSGNRIQWLGSGVSKDAASPAFQETSRAFSHLYEYENGPDKGKTRSATGSDFREFYDENVDYIFHEKQIVPSLRRPSEGIVDPFNKKYEDRFINATEYRLAVIFHEWDQNKWMIDYKKPTHCCSVIYEPLHLLSHGSHPRLHLFEKSLTTYMEQFTQNQGKKEQNQSESDKDFMARLINDNSNHVQQRIEKLVQTSEGRARFKSDKDFVASLDEKPVSSSVEKSPEAKTLIHGDSLQESERGKTP